MGLRELAGHLAAAAPDWAHTAWRVVAPGAAVMAALLGWRCVVWGGWVGGWVGDLVDG